MRKLGDIITSDDILGKDVIDSEGEAIGVSTKIHIDNRKQTIIGLTIDQGFMKPELYVGLEYVKKFGVDSILLNTSPKSKVRGLKVLDSNGKRIGYVDDIINIGKTNRFQGINIKESAFKKAYTVKSKYIKEIGHSVILRKNFIKEETGKKEPEEKEDNAK